MSPCVLIHIYDFDPPKSLAKHLDVKNMSWNYMIESKTLHVESAGPQENHHSCMCSLGMLSNPAVDALPAPGAEVHVTAIPSFLQADDLKRLCVQPCKELILLGAEAPAVP